MVESEQAKVVGSGPSGHRVLVLGGNFGGLTAAISLKHDLGDDVDVTVVSASDQFHR
jgi:sulfide:quinone oxidoreductase